MSKKKPPRYTKGKKVGHLEVAETPTLNDYESREGGKGEYRYKLICTRTGKPLTLLSKALRKRVLGRTADYCEHCKRKKPSESKVKPQDVIQMRWV